MPLLRRGPTAAASLEPLGVLVLPRKLEEFELAGHARDLLEVPRVVAVEPGRLSRRSLLGDDLVAVRQARRMRFPGQPRLLVLYDPRQYHLARALAVKHEAELWYFRGGSIGPPRDEQEGAELTMLDQLAGELAVQTLTGRSGNTPRTDNEPIRRRLVELEVISSRPFVPGARIRSR